ncbi:MAG: hypothetical protein AAF654_13985 [Myxococcota bacterium]
MSKALPGSGRLNRAGGAVLGYGMTTGAATVSGALFDATSLTLAGHDPSLERFEQSLQSSLAMVVTLQRLEAQMADGDDAAAQLTLRELHRLDLRMASIASRVESFTGQSLPWPREESGEALPIHSEDRAPLQIEQTIETDAGPLTLLPSQRMRFDGTEYSNVSQPALPNHVMLLSDDGGVVAFRNRPNGGLQRISAAPDALAIETNGLMTVRDGQLALLDHLPIDWLGKCLRARRTSSAPLNEDNRKRSLELGPSPRIRLVRGKNPLGEWRGMRVAVRPSLGVCAIRPTFFLRSGRTRASA